MEILFNYRPDGHEIETTNGTQKIMVIRKGPRGIVSVIAMNGPIVIWSPEDVDAHIGDTEEALIQKTIDVINAL